MPPPVPKSLTPPSYATTLAINGLGFLLPTLYATLSKLWLADLDASLVVPSDIYTYVGVIAEVLNEGLPRAAWVVIGDRSSRTLRARLALAHTLIAFQAAIGALLGAALAAAAPAFARGFVPDEVRSASLTYVRLSAFSVLAASVETSVASATRALDMPDVPFVASAVKTGANIVLDVLVISRFRVGGNRRTPSVNDQAAVRLACDLTAAACGLAYFLFATARRRRRWSGAAGAAGNVRPSVRALRVLAAPGAWTFCESVVRNALYLWLVSGIVALGAAYATAWGVFNTIRWGLVMVPVQSLEAASLAFVGHVWGEWRRGFGVEVRRGRAGRGSCLSAGICRPALWSLAIALAVEAPLCLFLSLYGCRPYARWLSGSDEVADITAHMWRTIDWCYIFYAASTQLATILLATQPRWYLYQSLVSNICYVLPWCIVVQMARLEVDDAWTYYAFIFGGSLVFSFFGVLVVEAVWCWRLMAGKMRLGPFVSA